MVTHEQYLAAKKIIEQWEHQQGFEDDWDDEDDFDERDWEEEEAELEEERLMEIASSCTCGAYTVTKEGKVIHVADCYCGAE